MSRNGSGVYSLPAGNPVVTGTTISSTWANTTLTDIANSLTQSVSADGQTPLTGSLQLGGFNVTNMGAATTAGNAVEYTQFQTPTFTGNVSITSTGFLLLPVGTTAQRPGTPANGEIRYNSDYNTFEGYNGSWGSIGGGATGGGNDQVFVENGVEVTTSYTLPSGKNASSIGPITIDAGATITVPSGQRWVIF